MKTIQLRNLQDRSVTRHGETHPGQITEGANADIVPGKSIRLHGVGLTRYIPGSFHTPGSWSEPLPYDRTFNIGDTAEYDSYNLHYTGTIISIAGKTVAIQEDGVRGKLHRLTITEFSRRNRDLDLVAIEERNDDVIRSC
jgi:hypothetical protein